MAVKLYKFKINFKLDIKQANQQQKNPTQVPKGCVKLYIMPGRLVNLCTKSSKARKSSSKMMTEDFG